MIVRTLPDGSTAIIGQTDHSRFVGQVAAHWGNERFAAPTPFDSVARAATYHDFGWLPYETQPRLNPDSGRPYQFHDLPFAAETLDAYQDCIDWLTRIDGYSGLLIGKHRTGLWQNRYDVLRQPAMHYNAGPALRPEIRRFIERNEAAQSKLAAGVDAAQLNVNYHLLQVWDHLGLYFCCRPPQDEIIDPVPDRYDAGAGVEMRLTALADWEVQFDPYPFDVRPLQLQIVHRHLPTATFASNEEWLHAYYTAPVATLTYTVI